MAKEKYQIKALKSAGGQYTIKKGGVYNVPTQIPEENAADLIKGGLATKIKSKSNASSRKAAERETR